MDKHIITADEARFATREAIEENINVTLETLNGRIKNAIDNGNYYLVTDLGLSNDVVTRLLENGYFVTNVSNMHQGCLFKISWEEQR